MEADEDILNVHLLNNCAPGPICAMAPGFDGLVGTLALA